MGPAQLPRKPVLRHLPTQWVPCLPMCLLRTAYFCIRFRTKLAYPILSNFFIFLLCTYHCCFVAFVGAVEAVVCNVVHLNWQDYEGGSLYGLEKFWAFHHYGGLPEGSDVEIDAKVGLDLWCCAFCMMKAWAAVIGLVVNNASQWLQDSYYLSNTVLRMSVLAVLPT